MKQLTSKQDPAFADVAPCGRLCFATEDDAGDDGEENDQSSDDYATNTGGIQRPRGQVAVS